MKYIIKNISVTKKYYIGSCIFYTGRFDNNDIIYNEYTWIKENLDSLKDYIKFSIENYKIIKEYDTLEEILIDIPELMLL